MKTFDAMFEDGKLRPFEMNDVAHLKEGERVQITVNHASETAVDEAAFAHLLDAELIDAMTLEADENITLEQVREALSGISGSLSSYLEEERAERF